MRSLLSASLSPGVSCEESLAREESLVRRRSLLGGGVGVSLVGRSLLSGQGVSLTSSRLGVSCGEESLVLGVSSCEETLVARSLLSRGVSRKSLVARSCLL